MSTPAEEIVAEEIVAEGAATTEPEVAAAEEALHADIAAIIYAGKGLPQSRVSDFKIQMAKKQLSLTESTPASLALATKACVVYGRKKERAAQASARQREALRSLKKNDAAEPEDSASLVAAIVPPMAAEVLLQTDVGASAPEDSASLVAAIVPPMAAEVLLQTDVVADVPTVAAVNEPVAAVAAVNKPVATQGLFVAAPYAVKVAPAKVVPKGSALRPDKTESLVAPGKGLFRPAVVKTPKRTGSLSNLFA